MMRHLEFYFLAYNVFSTDAPTWSPTQFCDGVEYTSAIGEQFLSDCNATITDLTISSCDSDFQDELEWGVANELYSSCSQAYCVYNSFDLAFRWTASSGCYVALYYADDANTCWAGAWKKFYTSGALNTSLTLVCFPAAPTVNPSDSPTNARTANPSLVPTETSSEAPTRMPTVQPSQHPTSQPSEVPSQAPTNIPTDKPSWAPTSKPTETPSLHLTPTPTTPPTKFPTQTPFGIPTDNHTKTPTRTPTGHPSEEPTSMPTETSTQPPTESPSQSRSPFEESIDSITWLGFIGILCGAVLFFCVVIFLLHKCCTPQVKLDTFPEQPVLHNSVWSDNAEESVMSETQLVSPRRRRKRGPSGIKNKRRSTTNRGLTTNRGFVSDRSRRIKAKSEGPRPNRRKGITELKRIKTGL